MALYVNCDLSADGWIGQYTYGRRILVINNLNKKFAANHKIYCSTRYTSTSQFGAIFINPTQKDTFKSWRTLGLFLINSRSQHGYRVLVNPNDRRGIKRYEIFHNFSYQRVKLCSKIGLYKVGVCIVTEPESKVDQKSYWQLTKKGWVFLGHILPTQYKGFIPRY